jgi:replication factor C small subunit
VAKVVEKHFPDFRRTLNELQKYSQSGSIDEGILLSGGDANMAELVEAVKNKDWKSMRAWVVNNLDNDPVSLFRKIYDTFLPLTNQVPQLVLTIADYQYKSAFVSDQEINLVACLTEIMASVEIRS